MKPRNSELMMRGSTALYRCSGPLQTTDGSTDQLAICDHAAQQIDVTSLKPCDREHCGCPGPGLGSPGERGGEGGKPGSARLHPARRRGLYSPRIVGDLLGLVRDLFHDVRNLGLLVCQSEGIFRPDYKSKNTGRKRAQQTVCPYHSRQSTVGHAGNHAVL